MRNYKVGDRDDTSDDAPNEGCPSIDPDGYMCTREEDHDGNHAAGNGYVISAVWGGEDSPQPDVSLDKFYDIALYGALVHAREEGSELNVEEFRRMWDAAVEANR